MSAEHQPENVESVENYSTLWSELIDRGGLYHISDQVCCECDTCMYIYDLILVMPPFYAGLPLYAGRGRGGPHTIEHKEF